VRTFPCSQSSQTIADACDIEAGSGGSGGSGGGPGGPGGNVNIVYDQRTTHNVYPSPNIGADLLTVLSMMCIHWLIFIVQPQLDQELRILDWLSPLNFKISQSEFSKKRAKGTGQWLLESQEFKTWRDDVSELLWCRGDRKFMFLNGIWLHGSADHSTAGTGKTILA
jgi:hypothetical protein